MGIDTFVGAADFGFTAFVVAGAAMCGIVVNRFAGVIAASEFFILLLNITTDSTTDDSLTWAIEDALAFVAFFTNRTSIVALAAVFAIIFDIDTILIAEIRFCRRAFTTAVDADLRVLASSIA